MFRSTLWTLVLRAKDNVGGAIEELLRIYWKPVYFYVRRRGAPVEDAKDLTQGFFSVLLERKFLKNVSKDKGRFRAFVLTALKRYLVSEAERAGAQKRGGGARPLSLDFVVAEDEYGREPAAKETLDLYFKRQWAHAVLSRALESLSREMDGRTFAAIKPHLAGGPSYSETAKTLGISEYDLNNLIHKTRKRYRALVRAEVVASVDGPAEVEEELADLFEALKP